MRYLWRKFLMWLRGIKVTGENMIGTDATLDTVNPEPSKYGYKWAIRHAIDKAKPPPPEKRRQRDIDAEHLARIKERRLTVTPKALNDLIVDDGLTPSDTPHFASLNLKTGEVTKA